MWIDRGSTGKDLLQQLDFRNSSNGHCSLILPFRENGQAKPAQGRQHAQWTVLVHELCGLEPSA